MKRFLLAGAVFLTAGAGTYFLLQERGDYLFNDSGAAAVFESSILPNQSTSSARTIIEHGVLVTFVDYENSGFNPKDLKIPVGSSAHFINKSGKALRVYSESQKTPYHFLNQPSSIGKGEKYKFNFTIKGFWEYYNLNHPKDKGSITVY